jgi:hypothetical protein
MISGSSINHGSNTGINPLYGVSSLTLATMNAINYFNPLKKMHTIDHKQKPIVKISYNKKAETHE